MNSAKDELIEIGRKLYQHRLVAGSEGNLSLRLDSGNILTTRRGVCKGEMTASDLVETDREGRIQTGIQPSTELKLHLEVYHQRPEVRAVIHAHPPHAVSLTLAGISLRKPYTPESVLLLGAVPVAPYATPSTPQLPDSIRPFISQTDVILLERHGSLTVGKTLQEAWQKLEILESTARMVWLAQQAGTLHPLPADEVRRLLEMRENVYGLDYPVMPFIEENQ